MAGHSQFKNIMHRKGKQDKMRSKIFSKLSREITVAAKAGLPKPNLHYYFKSKRALYRAVLGQLYPEKRITAALIWTDVPDFMELSDSALETALARFTSA